jgi:excinuclease UvrABC nuclease subunit
MSLKKLGGWWAVISSPPLQPFSLKANTFTGGVCLRNVKGVQRLSRRGGVLCGARRRAVRYGEEEYGHNEEIAMLEFYSQSAKGEALIVHAVVDDEEVQVLIFKVSFSFSFFLL